jgi:hypothetical protein
MQLAEAIPEALFVGVERLKETKAVLVANPQLGTVFTARLARSLTLVAMNPTLLLRC